MKTALKVVAALLLVVLVIALGVGFSFVRGARKKFEEKQIAAATRWEAVAPQYRADVARWKSDPLLQPRTGGDAAPVLFAHIGANERSAASSTVPWALEQQLRSPEEGDWPKNADALDVSAIDTAFMASLADAGSFDVEGEGSTLQQADYMPLTQDYPRYYDLMLLAKIHLTKGLTAGDARSAARDVRELARLCLQSEGLLPGMLGVGMLVVERLAREEAERRGQPVEGWTALSKEETTSLKRVLWAASAPYALNATGPLAEETPELGNCLGLSETLAMAHYLRAYFEPEAPERYARLAAALEQSTCRLTRARKAWKSNDSAGQLPLSGDALCRDDRGNATPDCQVPAWILRVPFVRSYMGYTLAAAAVPDWFDRYEEVP